MCSVHLALTASSWMREGTEWGPNIVITVNKSSLYWIQKFCVCFQNNINNVHMKTYQTFKSMILKCLIWAILKMKRIYLCLWQNCFTPYETFVVIIFFFLGIKHRIRKISTRSKLISLLVITWWVMFVLTQWLNGT